MKKITLIVACISLISLSSCKKDRVCECTTTTTDSSGDVTTDPADNTTYKEVKKGDAKSLCQKTTVVQVGSSGDTYTSISDCKLK